jgi:hypothetical protein
LFKPYEGVLDTDGLSDDLSIEIEGQERKLIGSAIVTGISAIGAGILLSRLMQDPSKATRKGLAAAGSLATTALVGSYEYSRAAIDQAALVDEQPSWE